MKTETIFFKWVLIGILTYHFVSPASGVCENSNINKQIEGKGASSLGEVNPLPTPRQPQRWWTTGSWDKPFWRTNVFHSGKNTVSIAIHFSEFTDRSESDWKILLKQRSGGEIMQEITPAMIFPKGNKLRPQDYWSLEIAGNNIVVEVYANMNPDGLNFKIDKYFFSDISPSTKGYMNPNSKKIRDIASFGENRVYRRLGKSVGRVYFSPNSKPVRCTGFVIGENKILTNRHCFCDHIDCNKFTEKDLKEKICSSTRVVFGYERGSNYKDWDVIRCKKIIQLNYPLDYSLLELMSSPNKKWGTLKIKNENPKGLSKNQNLFVIQHPMDKIHQGFQGVAFQNCKVKLGATKGLKKKPGENSEEYERKQEFHHTCDTFEGSSGSPIFNNDELVVGLHSTEFFQNQKTQYNIGILMEEIYKDLKELIK